MASRSRKTTKKALAKRPGAQISLAYVERIVKDCKELMEVNTALRGEIYELVARTIEMNRRYADLSEKLTESGCLYRASYDDLSRYSKKLDDDHKRLTEENKKLHEDLVRVAKGGALDVILERTMAAAAEVTKGPKSKPS